MSRHNQQNNVPNYVCLSLSTDHMHAKLLLFEFFADTWSVHAFLLTVSYMRFEVEMDKSINVNLYHKTTLLKQ